MLMEFPDGGCSRHATANMSTYALDTLELVVPLGPGSSPGYRQ